MVEKLMIGLAGGIVLLVLIVVLGLVFAVPAWAFWNFAVRDVFGAPHISLGEVWGILSLMSFIGARMFKPNLTSSSD